MSKLQHAMISKLQQVEKNNQDYYKFLLDFPTTGSQPYQIKNGSLLNQKSSYSKSFTEQYKKDGNIKFINPNLIQFKNNAKMEIQSISRQDYKKQEQVPQMKIDPPHEQLKSYHPIANLTTSQSTFLNWNKQTVEMQPPRQLVNPMKQQELIQDQISLQQSQVSNKLQSVYGDTFRSRTSSLYSSTSNLVKQLNFKTYKSPFNPNFKMSNKSTNQRAYNDDIKIQQYDPIKKHNYVLTQKAHYKNMYKTIQRQDFIEKEIKENKKKFKIKF